jgi:hypothetical protein
LKDNAEKHLCAKVPELVDEECMDHISLRLLLKDRPNSLKIQPVFANVMALGRRRPGVYLTQDEVKNTSGQVILAAFLHLYTI